MEGQARPAPEGPTLSEVSSGLAQLPILRTLVGSEEINHFPLPITPTQLLLPPPSPLRLPVPLAAILEEGNGGGERTAAREGVNPAGPRPAAAALRASRRPQPS